MDVQMPEMDGFEATAAIRAREKQSGAHLPIIAMTAHAMKGDRQRCLEAGMDEYIAKPIRTRRLFETIVAVLGGPPESGKPSRAAAADEEEGPEDTLDWSEALRTVRGDRQLLKEMVEAFREESPRLMAEIRRAVEAGDAAALRVSAHSLKGSLRYFGAHQAFDDAFQLEKMAKQNDLSIAESFLASLEGEMVRLTPVLLKYLRDH